MNFVNQRKDPMQNSHIDPLHLTPRFLARRKSSLHRIGPGIEELAIDLMLDGVEEELRQARTEIVPAAQMQRRFDQLCHDTFGEPSDGDEVRLQDEDGERWDGQS